MIKTDDYFEPVVETHVWRSTEKQGVLRKKEVPPDTPYSTWHLLCRVCGLKITGWTNVASEEPMRPKDLMTFKEVHALRHQVAGEFPPVGRPFLMTERRTVWSEGLDRWRWLCPACGVVRPVEEHRPGCDLERRMRERPRFY